MIKTYNSFISESIEPINVEIEKLIRLYCPYILNEKNISRDGHSKLMPVYKGFSDLSNDSYIITPSNRVSKNTYNYYTLIMDNWENFPKRSKSIICSTSSLRAKKYGKVYRVIPFDKNALFAIAPQRDIWISFNNELDIFNEKMESVLIDSDFYTGVSDLNELNIFLKEKYNLSTNETIDSLKKKLPSTVFDIFENGLKNFDLINYIDTNFSDYEEEKEVWLSSSSLLIEASKFDQWFHNKFNKPGIDKYGWNI